jgi:hypothetical protein
MAKPKTGTAQVNVELPAEFLDEFKQFAEGRGEKIREAIYHAMRRHMAYPPPPPVLPCEPLPDSPEVGAEVPQEDAPKKVKGKGKK